MMNLSISFIIPAFNEEEYIQKTIQDIKINCPNINFEIYVSDNGSADSTVQLLEQLVVPFSVSPNVTISKLRNLGVKETIGEILVFIDADVSLTPEWKKNMLVIIDELKAFPLNVTGSRCLPPPDNNWFNKYWFKRLAEYDAPYVNSGHMITTRTLFDKIGGFDEALKTAEDYDFCMRAKAAGAEVKNNPDLPVIHWGYPQKIKDFIRRERWHGRQDFANLKSLLASKVALAAAFSLVLFVFSLLGSFYFQQPAFLLGYSVVMFSVSVFLTIIKFSIRPFSSLFQTSAIFFLYLWGRSFSLVDRLLGKTLQRGRES